MISRFFLLYYTTFWELNQAYRRKHTLAAVFSLCSFQHCSSAALAALLVIDCKIENIAEIVIVYCIEQLDPFFAVHAGNEVNIILLYTAHQSPERCSLVGGNAAL